MPPNEMTLPKPIPAMKRHLIQLLLMPLLCAATVRAGGPSDILIYKFTLTQTWEHNEVAISPATGELKGHNPLRGVLQDNSYWVLATGNAEMAEIRYFIRYFPGGVKAKAYSVMYWPYLERDINMFNFDQHSSSNFMELLKMPDLQDGQTVHSFRDSFAESDVTPGSSYRNSGYVWDLLGSAKSTLFGTLTLPNVASLLQGNFQRSEAWQTREISDGEITRFFSRRGKGTQRATIDKPLTLKANTVAIGSAEVKSLDNGVIHVLTVLEKLGYDEED
jgi:hypothetical protein